MVITLFLLFVRQERESLNILGIPADIFSGTFQLRVCLEADFRYCLPGKHLALTWFRRPFLLNNYKGQFIHLFSKFALNKRQCWAAPSVHQCSLLFHCNGIHKALGSEWRRCVCYQGRGLPWWCTYLEITKCRQTVRRCSCLRGALWLFALFLPFVTKELE